VAMTAQAMRASLPATATARGRYPAAPFTSKLAL
jgi:hypothetical protein